MSKLAQELHNEVYGIDTNRILANPDKIIEGWRETEYKLFQSFEDKEFTEHGQLLINNVQTLIDYGNSLTNRRKARAGKSLEHHLAAMFTLHKLVFEEQVRTEGNKRPDFIFPNGESYHNLLFPGEALTFLGAKTTCKDRWRQVLNEADRIPNKYLYTIQEGVSVNQLKEMKAERLTLVVPAGIHNKFNPAYRKDILTLQQFICQVKAKQDKYYPIAL
ncbi:MAG: hypothetical protein LIP02_12110 [Bacteroidales bacterium]|nr:hypothetical protein [Bacteroidales bacterium]